MDLGKTFKKIRLNKNLKQSYFINENISQSMISYFENGQRKMEAENFLYLLEKLQMDLEEFHLIKSRYEANKRQVIFNTYNTLKFNDETMLKNLMKECQVYLKETSKHDVYIQHIIKICERILILSKDHSFNRAREVILPVWKYYEKQDYWYIQDLKIINSIFFIFNSEDAIYVVNQMEKNLNKLPDTNMNKKLKLSIRSNLVALLMETKNWTKSLDLLYKNLSMYKLDMNYIFLAVHFNRIAVCMYKLEMQEYLSYIDKANALLEIIEETEFKHKLKKEFETWMNK